MEGELVAQRAGQLRPNVEQHSLEDERMILHDVVEAHRRLQQNFALSRTWVAKRGPTFAWRQDRKARE